MLELKDICKTFNPNTINAKVALNHLNLTLNDGDFVTVIGGNGAGKSTMLNAIAGVFQVGRRPENQGKNIVVIVPDNGMKYLSTPMYRQK